MSTLGTLRAADGEGIVSLEGRLDAAVDDVWSALTDPRCVAQWLGELDGDLHQGREFRSRYFASGWEGTVRVDVCQLSHRLLLATSSPEEPDAVIEVTLAAEGQQTVLVV